MAKEYVGIPDDTVEVVQKLFSKYDLDQDCRLAHSEFRKVLVAVGLRDLDAKAIYSKVDVHSDGSVDMRKFVKWLYSENNENTDVAQRHTDKLNKHMQQPVMTKEEAMKDFFDFMAELKKQYRYVTRRDVVVLERDLRDAKEKEGTRDFEKSRDCRLKDFFDAVNLDSNGKLTMAEFVRGINAFGNDGKEMTADIFRAINQEKSQTRVWDRKYHDLKRLEEDQAALGRVIYLVPACEIFERSDMQKWNKGRADAIYEAMRAEEESIQEALSLRREKEMDKRPLIIRIARLEDKINAKRAANSAEEKKDSDLLHHLNEELACCERTIELQTAIVNQARFQYTQTKYRDGSLDFSEFKKCMHEFEKTTKALSS